MSWKKVVTRNYRLLDAYYSQLAYGEIPGFNIKNVLIVGKNGIVERYLDEGELDQFYNFIKKSKTLKREFEKALKIDAELVELIKKDPLKVFPIFHGKYLEFWRYSLLAYYSGQVFNAEELTPFKKEVEFIRGGKSVKEEIEGHFFEKLLKKLEKKTGISFELLGYAFPEEIIANKFDAELLKKRREGYLWVIKNRKSSFYIGEKAGEIEKNELESEEIDYSQLNEVKGVVASPGCVKGRVKVLLKFEDSSKVAPGDVLVTHMTNPKFSLAMKNAAAFVTDEGGLTCHAAIIARELLKPCIIGTRIATKVFKDGDLIEVNTGEKVVRIIKRG